MGARPFLLLLVSVSALLGGCAYSSPASSSMYSGYSSPASSSMPAAASAAPASGGAVVTLNHDFISPAKVTIKAGETVKWVNQVAMNHSPIGEGWRCDLGPDNTCARAFDTPGTYPYKESGHEATGTVVVS